MRQGRPFYGESAYGLPLLTYVTTALLVTAAVFLLIMAVLGASRVLGGRWR